MVKKLKLYIIPLWGLTGALMVVWAGMTPNYHSITPTSEQGYPLVAILTFLVIILIESLIVYLAIRPQSYKFSHWGRASVSFSLVLFMCFFWLQGVMHAPEFYFKHLWWLLSSGIVLLCLVIISVLSTMKGINIK